MSQNFDKAKTPKQIRELSIKIPSKLAIRVEAYAEMTNSTVTGVVIEALDIFLREQINRQK